GLGDTLYRVAQFLGDELGGIAVDHIGDLQHDALFHQDLDDIHRALRHAVREFLDGDDFRDHDLAHNFLRRVLNAHMLLALTLHTTAHRGKRALTPAII